MIHHLSRLWNDALDFIYPPQCIICSAGEHAPQTPHLCQPCLNVLFDEPVPPPFDLAAQLSDRGVKSFFDESYAAWPFSEMVQKLVHAMKYEDKPLMARLLARGMSQRIDLDHRFSFFEFILAPVPMHPRRRRERGYNQSELLAQEMAGAWDMPLNTKALRRARDTVQQALLSAEERRSNVEGAFAIKPPDFFKNKNVILIDDVLTTGSTVNACAEALKTAGAVRVLVLTVARA
jgi:ComF family protein